MLGYDFWIISTSLIKQELLNIYEKIQNSNECVAKKNILNTLDSEDNRW